MSESNPVEIVIAAIVGRLNGVEDTPKRLIAEASATAVIAALEREGGFKLMRREATEEMVDAAKQSMCRYNNTVITTDALEAAWDAAPSYATLFVVSFATCMGIFF